MKKSVLFTEDKNDFAQGIEHLLADGLWIRLLTKKDKKSAYIYSLDKSLLVEFADIFGLTKFRDGHTVKEGSKILYPFCIEVWGNKLEPIIDWKRELSGNDQSAARVSQG